MARKFPNGLWLPDLWWRYHKHKQGINKIKEALLVSRRGVDTIVRKGERRAGGEADMVFYRSLCFRFFAFLAMLVFFMRASRCLCASGMAVFL